MPDIRLDEIVHKTFDILKADAGIKHLNWELGRLTPFGLRSFPAGTVSIGPGTELGWSTSPSGFGGIVAVRIALYTADHTGVAASEATIQDLISKTYKALFTLANIQLDITGYSTKPWLTSVATQDVISNAEASPAWAEAVLIANYTIRS